MTCSSTYMSVLVRQVQGAPSLGKWCFSLLLLLMVAVSSPVLIVLMNFPRAEVCIYIYVRTCTCMCILTLCCYLNKFISITQLLDFSALLTEWHDLINCIIMLNECSLMYMQYIHMYILIYMYSCTVHVQQVYVHVHVHCTPQVVCIYIVHSTYMYCYNNNYDVQLSLLLPFLPLNSYTLAGSGRQQCHYHCHTQVPYEILQPH